MRTNTCGRILYAHMQTFPIIETEIRSLLGVQCANIWAFAISACFFFVQVTSIRVIRDDGVVAPPHAAAAAAAAFPPVVSNVGMSTHRMSACCGLAKCARGARVAWA